MRPPCTHAQNLFVYSLRELKQKHVRLVREKKEMQHKVRTGMILPSAALKYAETTGHSSPLQTRAHIRLLSWKVE